MQEIIIPEDGLLYRTASGNPVLEISQNQGASLLKLFSQDGVSTVILLCHDDESGIHIGKSNRSISFIVNDNKNEIRFTNEHGQVTHLIYTDENGGNIDLCDADQNSLLSMGIGSNGKASIFLRNAVGEFVVGVFHDRDRGIIVLQNEAGDPIWSSEGPP